MAAWIKMPLGMKLGLGQGDFVLDGDHAPPPKKGAKPPNFGPCLLRPNGWMDEAGTWHGGRLQPRRLCVRWGPSPLPPKGGGAPLPNFRPFLLCPNGSMHQMPLGMEAGLGPGDIVLDGDPGPSQIKEQTPNFRPMSIVAKRLDGSR